MQRHNEKLVGKLKKAGAAGILAALLSGTALAEPVTLREDMVVSDSIIRIGDLFEGAGDNAGVAIMEAPAPGKSDSLTIYELDKIAEQYELDWERPKFLKRVRVVREGVAFDAADLKSVLMDQIASAGMDGDFEIQVYGNRRGLYLPLDATVQDIEIESFELTAMKDRFTAVLLLPTGTTEPERLTLNGRLEEMRLVPTLNRFVAPGEVISKADISWERYPTRRITARAVLNPENITGMTVRRALQPGKLILENDVEVPVVIEKGSVVTMTLRSGGLTLSASGRALEDGGAGQIIRVMNAKSKQSVDARVVRPGLAEVVAIGTLNLASAM